MKKQRKIYKPKQAIVERTTGRGFSGRRDAASSLSPCRRCLFRIISLGIVPLLLLVVIEAGLAARWLWFRSGFIQRNHH